MLVLTRKINERTVCITASGEEIEVVVLAIESGKIRLGFLASSETLIHRSEVWKRIQDEKEAG